MSTSLQPPVAAIEATTEPARLAPRAAVRAALDLARREGALRAHHPAVLALGVVGLLPLLTWADPEQPMAFTVTYLGIWLWGLAGGAMIASHLAVRRPVRDQATDIHDPTPLSAPIRVAGHLLAGVVPVAYAVVAVVGVIMLHSARGVTGSIDLAEAATGPMLVAGGSALGVLTGRSIPLNIGWLAGLGTVAAWQMLIGTIEPESHPARGLAPWATHDQFLPVELLTRDAGWHLMYLAGLVAFAAVAATVERRMSKRTLVAGALALSLAATGGWGQMRPPSDAEADRIAMVASFLPGSCRDRGPWIACVVPGDEHLAVTWLTVASATLAEAPAPVRARDLVIEQRYGPSTLRALAPEVRARLQPGIPSSEPFVWPDTGIVRVDRRGAGDATAVALRVAMWAVGMPLEPGTRPATADDTSRLLRHPLREGSEPPVREGVPVLLRCVAQGQARAAIALWLTMQAHPKTAEELRLGLPGNDPSDGLVDARRDVAVVPSDTDELLFIEPPTWDQDMPAPALFGVSDLRIADTMMSAPAEQVRDTLARHWDELVAPATPTTRLVELLGLEQLDPAARRLPYDPVEPACA